MVCSRCVTTVEGIFNSLEIQLVNVSLGEVKVLGNIEAKSLNELKSRLESKGFELIDDKKSLLLEKTKAAIIDLIHHQDHFELKVNWSNYLSEKLEVDYGYLSSLFSSINGITLEQSKG